MSAPTTATVFHEGCEVCGESGWSWPLDATEQLEAAVILKDSLAMIEHLDQDYEPRYVLVLMAVAMATTAGLKAGFAIDPAEPDWPVAYIELPTGQVSWHLPAHMTVFDGHDKAEKYARVRAYVGEPERTDTGSA